MWLDSTEIEILPKKYVLIIVMKCMWTVIFWYELKGVNDD